MNTETLALIRWIAQKELLGQDICLIGEPGPARRWLAMLYCRYAQREVQTLSLSRDTTEADIKQRKEIRKGTLSYLNQAAVNAALNGHVLILEGLERAERNVLPVLNNLLENREMNLDDGRLLVHPSRYDQLVAELGESAVAELGLLRVSEHFRVIALAVPVPKYPGNPLDPPLRSRFQCLYVPPPSTAALWTSLGDTPAAAEALLKFKGALTATGEKGSDNDKTLHVEPIGDYELLELGRQHSRLPAVPLGVLLSRLYPWRLYSLRKASNSSAEGPKGNNAAKKEDDGTEALQRLLQAYRLSDDKLPSKLLAAKVTRNSSSGEAIVTLRDGSTFRCCCGPLQNDTPAELGSGDCFMAEPHFELFTGLLQSHSCGRHICLVGPPGSGKTVLVREFAAQLGYPVHVQHLYADMSTRDLFQRRSTDENGDTTWEPSALVQAAIDGHIAVLDGIDNLPPHTLCVLQELLVDGSATLLDGGMLKPKADYDQLKESLGVDDATMRERSVFPVHPNFRVIAIARPPSTKNGKKFWLTSDIACLFDYHLMPAMSPEVLAVVLVHLATQRVKSTNNQDTPVADEKLLHAIATALVRLQQGLVELAAREDSKLPQLSLRQMVRIIQFGASFPKEVREFTASSLLVPLMSTLSADLVLKQFAQCGIDSISGSTGSGTGKIAAAFGSMWGRGGGSPTSGKNEEGSTTGPLRAENRGGAVELWAGDRKVFTVPRVYTNEEKSLVPHVHNYYNNHQHNVTLQWLAKQLNQSNKILLVGNQGVGKNKIVDHFLSLAGLPRHYIQLHRDTTVASLTINPRVEAGKVIWEDSPLVKAVSQGHVLVIDEIDKAPVDVVQVLKGLVEDREMTLSDGRRISAWDEGDSAVGSASASAASKRDSIIKIHPDFRLIVLANPPGYPFHGNDFYRECGDLFACHVLENPDARSQEELLLKYAPQVPKRLLHQLIMVFADLRVAVKEGTLQYPFSLRELIHVVRHLQAFPQDGVFQALNNVFNFDLEDQHTMDTVRRVLAQHLNRNAGIMKNRLAKAVPLSRQEAIAAISASMEGTQLPATFIDWADTAPVKLPLVRMSSGSNTNSALSANGDDFTEIKQIVHLPFEENRLTVHPIKVLGGIGGSLTTVLCRITPQEGSAAVEGGLYLATYASGMTLGQRPALSPGAVALVGLPADWKADTIELLPSLFDSTVSVVDASRGRIAVVNVLSGEGTNHSLFEPSSEKSVRCAYNPQIPGMVSITAEGTNTLRLWYFNKLLAVTFPEPLQPQSAIVTSQILQLRLSSGQDGFLKLFATADNIVGKWFPVSVQYTGGSATKALLGPVLGHAGGLSNPGSPSQLNTSDLSVAMEGPGNSDVAMFIATAPNQSEGNATKLEVNVEMLSNPGGAAASLSGQAVTVAPWDSELKQRVTFDPKTGKLQIVNGRDRTVRTVNLTEHAPGLKLTANASDELRAQPVVGYDASTGYSTVFTTNGSAAVVDTNQERLEREYNRWASVMEGKGGALGAPPTAQNLDLSYSTPRVEPSGSLKHGKETDSPHVGGNTWAGGTGGTDTAGLGGLIGPYRLDKGHKVHQVHPDLKKKVPQHIIDEAKHMGKVALQKRLDEIGMSPLDNDRYMECYGRVRGCISQLQLMYNGLNAKEGERVWLKHQSDGVWDDAKIVEGITGEKNIYKRRGESTDASMFQQKKKKRLLFVLDVSASMYRFNHHDQRLTRLIETAVMIMESFVGHEEKISYSIVGHNGDSANLPLVEWDKPPKNKKERMDVALKMSAHAQFCWSGDNTVNAMKRSIPNVLAEPGDDYFVFVISDANLEQYGISTTDLSRIIRSSDKVHMYCIFIASFGAQASHLNRALPPGHGFECLDTQQLPLILKRIFVAADLLGGA
jgi:MoxR-like ATPase